MATNTVQTSQIQILDNEGDVAKTISLSGGEICIDGAPISTGTGDIGGSTGSTDNALIRADGTGGSTIQSASQITINDSGKMTIAIATEQGLEVTSSLGAGAGQNLVLIETTDAAWDRPLLRINDVSTAGGAASIRLDGPNPDIEFIETDQTTPAGKFELAVNADQFQFNGRNAADNSFEQVMSFHRLADGGMVGIGGTAGDVPNARLEVSVPGSNSYFMLSPTIGAASGDVLDVDTNGNLVFNDRASAVTARFEGDTDANLFYVNGPQDKVNIGMTSTQNGKLNVNGIIQSGLSATTTGGVWIGNSGGAGFSKLVAPASASDTTITMPDATGVVGLKHITSNTQTDSYTLVLTDDSKLIIMNKGTANDLTVPLNASVAFPTGTQIIVQQLGAGQTTIVATGGVTLQAQPGLKVSAQYGVATLIKVATDTWIVSGALSA